MDNSKTNKRDNKIRIKKIEIIRKLKKIRLPKFDIIVAIGRDGIEPAHILKRFLGIPVYTIYLNYRDKNNKPIHKEPILKKPISNRLKKIKNKNILIVDAISKTGKTLKKAKRLLKGNKTKTFVINGNADYSLFRYKKCIKWPWN